MRYDSSRNTPPAIVPMKKVGPNTPPGAPQSSEIALREHQRRHQRDSKLARERCVDYWITVGKILRQRDRDKAHDRESGGQFKRLRERQPPKEPANCMKKPDIRHRQQPEKYSHQSIRNHLPVASNHERGRMEDHGVADD